MNANKIELNGGVILDLTQDTVTEADVAEGKTFHLADGTPATGTQTPVTTQEKSVDITENGTTEVLPDAGYALSKVTVNTNVEGSGGGSGLEPGGYFIQNKLRGKNSYYQRIIKYNGETYLFTLPYTGSGNEFLCYKLTDGAWTTHIGTKQKAHEAVLLGGFYFNGKYHFIGGYGEDHYSWAGGTTFTQHGDLPVYSENGFSCVYQGKIYANTGSKGVLYAWDESTDTWEEQATIGYGAIFVINDVLYLKKGNKICRYDNGAVVELGTTSSYNTPYFVKGNCAYYQATTATETKLLKFDVVQCVETYVGACPRTSRFYVNLSDNDQDGISVTYGSNDGGFDFYDFYEFEATE